MPPGAQRGSPDGERLARIEEQMKHMGAAVAEIKSMLASQSNEDKTQLALVNAIQRNCVEHASTMLSLRRDVDQVQEEQGEQRKAIKAISNEVAKNAAPMRIMIYVGAVFGGSVITLIWALITGAARIVFQ